ncbi:uncharacterized protein PGTG_20561 [Puccinia graminis f. sp. tritici CRL 75-36-700-3]|uniref:Uncharacterized protein n=1 Tax=Puccinia graminis f. sp. tritici (strain CRL 75-36-700-3 / race SCCL) TaxID=418459 RepID=E3NYF6_PUCGT|nr:uncharacterized protein PGTG_20561 [Puccinia graminis f. sp. tritici CRL 75-36-700-3]EFP94605.1 hypothetical protein PGTG_20561 [Puccinia graminis f. sp. tritici CRL 75-36-700-3]
MAVSDSPEEETGIHSLPTVPQDPARSSEPPTKADSTGEKVTPSLLGQSKHNPRSPSFNVEHALADAMYERSIGSIAALEFVRSQSFTEFPRSDSSDPSRPSSELPPSDTLVLEPDQPKLWRRWPTGWIPPGSLLQLAHSLEATPQPAPNLLNVSPNPIQYPSTGEFHQPQQAGSNLIRKQSRQGPNTHLKLSPPLLIPSPADLQAGLPSIPNTQLS